MSIATDASDAGPNLRILLVDDNPAIHEDYKKVLQCDASDSDLDELSALVLGEAEEETRIPEFTLDSALQGEEALALVEKAESAGRPYAVAFVDMRMPPGWDGLRTIEEIWKVAPKMQIVICSAYSDHSWAEIIDRVAYRDRLLILKKPFDNIEVCQLAIALTQKWELERAAEAQAESIVETAPDAIVGLDQHGVVLECNSSTCELLGRGRDELVGARFESLFAGPESPSWRELASQVDSPESNGRIQAIDLRVQGAGDEPIAVQASLSGYETPSGRKFTAIVRDLREYKKLQEGLAQARKLESVGQLAAGVAHEINTPLQYIQQNVEFLEKFSGNILRVFKTFEENLSKEGPSRSWDERLAVVDAALKENRYEMMQAELPEAISECLDGVRRIVTIVQAMHEFTQPGHDEWDVADVRQAIEGAVSLTRNQWKEFADVKLEIASDLPQPRCIPSDINQLVLNLVVNAADAIEEKIGSHPEQRGTITIAAGVEDDWMAIKVTDDGCGIPADVCERIFDPFFTTKDVDKGTGQGLTVAYDAVVHRHRGTLSVESEPGRGSEFTARWPMAGPEGQQLAQASEPDLQPSAC